MNSPYSPPDEATSALDSESEKLVQEALDNLLNLNNGNRMTTVIVAHRLQTVRNADQIAVINDGRVVEMGRHKELIQLEGGLYYRMVRRASGDGLLPEDGL